MNGKLAVEEGLLAVQIQPGGHIGAAVTASGDVAGDVAGIEIELAGANVHIGTPPDRPNALTLDIATERAEMERLLMMLAEALGLPAFTEGEWRITAEALRETAGEPGAFNMNGLTRVEMALKIEEAYS